MPRGRMSEDLTGNKFNLLTVIERVGKNSDGRVTWRCLCDCGNEHVVSGRNLRKGLVKSCGCLKSNSSKLCKKHSSDLSGLKFGRLTVIKRGEIDLSGYKWQCRCDCGAEVEVQRSALTSKAIKSCGCHKRDIAIITGMANKTHGATTDKEKLPTYKIWLGMRKRCREIWNKKYGGRGIKVCERWVSFENFVEDMGLRPSNKHSIDRIDVNGNYEPSNCRWATSTEQANNRRSSRYIEFNGEIKTISEWAKIYSIKPATIITRIERGWSIEKSLLTPVER